MKKLKEIINIFFFYSINQRHRLSDGWTGEVLHKPRKKKQSGWPIPPKRGMFVSKDLPF